jgi:hypothetical protein
MGATLCLILQVLFCAALRCVVLNRLFLALCSHSYGILYPAIIVCTLLIGMWGNNGHSDIFMAKKPSLQVRLPNSILDMLYFNLAPSYPMLHSAGHSKKLS